MIFQAKLEQLNTIIGNFKDVYQRFNIKDFTTKDKLSFINKDKNLTLSIFTGKVFMEINLHEKKIPELELKLEKDFNFSISLDTILNGINSFRDSILCFDVKDNTLEITEEANVKNKQVVPFTSEEVMFPKKGTKYIKEFTVNANTWLNSTKWIYSAIGFEEQTPQWLYSPMRVASSKKVRFVAGIGGRLSVRDIEGDDLIKSDPSTFNFLLSKDVIYVTNKVLSYNDVDSFTVRQTDPKSGSNQIQTTIGNYDLIFMNMHPNISWPDESQLLNADYPIKFTIKQEEFEKAMLGIMSTFGLSKNIHISEIDVDFVNKKITIEALDGVKSVREINVVDFKSDINSIKFKCFTLYLNEILNNNRSSSYYQFNLISPNKVILVNMNSDGSIKDKNDIVLVKDNLKIKDIILMAPV